MLKQEKVDRLLRWTEVAAIGVLGAAVAYIACSFRTDAARLTLIASAAGTLALLVSAGLSLVWWARTPR
jgi:predicted phage tail protein